MAVKSTITKGQAHFSSTKHVDLTKFLSSSLSMRRRARLALAAVFLVAAPTLLIGVIRTEEVAVRAARLGEYDDYWKRLLETRVAIKDLDLAIWAYSVEQEFETGQAVLMASTELKQSIENMVLERPLELDLGPEGFLEGLVARLDGLIKRSVANRNHMAQVRLSILTVAKELKTIEKRVVEIANQERIRAFGSLSKVGRDQLILFLIVLFFIPIFVGFAPGFIVAPLTRLRQIISKIEMGQLKDMSIRGRDEVAMLARTLKSHFFQKEEIDRKKSSKIFEMRNVLRAVLNRVKEPVFIVDGSTKINYTNDAAAQLLGQQAHQIEGKLITDCMYSNDIKKAYEKAFIGDVVDEVMRVTGEVPDGRTFSLDAKLGVVRNRDGEIARAVLVLYKPEQA